MTVEELREGERQEQTRVAQTVTGETVGKERS